MAEGTLVITISNQVAAPPPVAAGVFITGWHVPSIAEWLTLFYTIDAVNGPAVAGGPLKEIGTTHWNSPNTGATDVYNFTALPAGYREELGVFIEMGNIGMFWIDETDPLNDVAVSMHCDSFDVKTWQLQYYWGAAIRLIKDDSTNPGTVTDYDGNTYPTVKIGTQVWMKTNLATTHYANGTAIPIVTDDAAWAALTTAGMCYYNNTP